MDHLANSVGTYEQVTEVSVDLSVEIYGLLIMDWSFSFSPTYRSKMEDYSLSPLAFSTLSLRSAIALWISSVLFDHTKCVRLDLDLPSLLILIHVFTSPLDRRALPPPTKSLSPHSLRSPCPRARGRPEPQPDSANKQWKWAV